MKEHKQPHFSHLLRHCIHTCGCFFAQEVLKAPMLFSELQVMDLAQQLRAVLGPVWGPGHLLSSVVPVATIQVSLEGIGPWY